MAAVFRSGLQFARGFYPKGGLLLDSAGSLYGTTSSGGPHSTGTVYKVTP